MRRGVVGAILAALVVFSSMLAGPVVTLKDGREMKGVDLRQEEGLYLLEIANGSVIPIPMEAVKEVGWAETESGAGKDSSSRPIANIVTGRTEEEARQAQERAASKDREQAEWESARRAEKEEAAQKAREERERREEYNAPAGHYMAGQNLAGPPVHIPTTSEQLGVFGEPSKFAQDVVHFDLGPSYWVPDPEEAMGSPSTFMNVGRDPTWVPTDGFAKGGS